MVETLQLKTETTGPGSSTHTEGGAPCTSSFATEKVTAFLESLFTQFPRSGGWRQPGKGAGERKAVPRAAVPHGRGAGVPQSPRTPPPARPPPPPTVGTPAPPPPRAHLRAGGSDPAAVRAAGLARAPARCRPPPAKGSAARRPGLTAARLPGSPGSGEAARPAAPPPRPAPWACKALRPPAAASLRTGTAPPWCSPSPPRPRGPESSGARHSAETWRTVGAPAFPETHRDSLKPELCSVPGRRKETLIPFI